MQKELGCSNALAFDLTTACSGFVLGLVTASCFIKAPIFKSCDSHCQHLENCTLKLFVKTGLSLYMDHDDRSIMCVDAGGGYENVLVVGADALSRYVDWMDRGTCIKNTQSP